jgi:thioredoxin reductase (NADPH)
MSDQVIQGNEGQRDGSALEGVDFSRAEHRQVIIIGSGPAGYTAALYASRANLEPLVVQGGEPGGQLTTTTDVENYPGFPDGIQGPELMDLFEKQAVRFGAEVLFSVVTTVDFSRRPFRVLVGEDKPFLADAVIIATGASAQYLGLKNEKRLLGRGVSACATCDGFFFKDQEIAVIGGGDTAMEESLFLTRFTKHVHVIHRRDALRASKIMQDRALNNEKISFIWDTVVEDVRGDDSVTGVALKNVKTGEQSILGVTGLFIAIGHKPNTEIFRGWLHMDEKGYIATAHGSTLTNVPGVFASGDAIDHVYRQAITAAGTGCMAAIDAERFLAENPL